MKLLPTTLTTDQVRSLIDTMRSMPSAQVEMTNASVSVYATKKTTGETVRVFSAVRSGAEWLCESAPGLVKIRA
jgi:hypothetical protein